MGHSLHRVPADEACPDAWGIDVRTEKTLKCSMEQWVDYSKNGVVPKHILEDRSNYREGDVLNCLNILGTGPVLDEETRMPWLQQELDPREKWKEEVSQREKGQCEAQYMNSDAGSWTVSMRIP